MDELERRVLHLGPFPNARNANDWARLRDTLATDVNLQSLAHQLPWPKKQVKEKGGIAAVLIVILKDEMPFLDSAAWASVAELAIQCCFLVRATSLIATATATGAVRELPGNAPLPLERRSPQRGGQGGQARV